MEIPFTYQRDMGRVVVFEERTFNPEFLGADDGTRGLANCKATIEFSAHGYLAYFGWVQLVRSTDNDFRERQFELDLFDPFKLYEQAPTPYYSYGFAPTLFDAPSREKRVQLDWVAHTFLATSPLQGNRRVVTPLLGFSWGFHIIDNKNIELKPLTSLTDVDWESHLSYLRERFTEWQFTEMRKPER